MAEAFGLAASVLSVASLAIQLGDSLQKAYEFWESIEDGPDHIRRLSSELRFLANIFYSIPLEDHSGLQEQLVKSSLELAKKDIDELASLISELARAIGPNQTRMKRRWGRVKIVLKSGTIAKMRGYIESSKNILILLEAKSTQSAVRQMHGRLDVLTATISTNQQHLQAENISFGSPPRYQSFLQPAPVSLVRVTQKELWDGPLDQMTNSNVHGADTRIRTTTAFKTIDAGLGILTVRSTSARLLSTCGTKDDSSESSRKTIVINFLWRFATCRRGFRLSTNETFDSWSFNTIWKRSADSQIFELCKIGNTFGVDELLRYGRASVFDADPEGSTPLHYACKYGHSNLARLLVDRGADIYARTDFGNSPIEDLEDFDRQQNAKDRKDIANIVDTMIRYANFDPFDWEDLNRNFDALTLWNGLPYENLNYLLAMKDSYTAPEQRFDLILGNILQLRDSVESNQECIDLLLIEYEKLRSTTKAHDGWHYNFTLLQHLVFHWLDRNEGLGRGVNLKISRALKLTDDLWRRDREGTILDTVARYDGGMVNKWLEFLSHNGINISEYCQYEQAQHPEGIINQGPDACCRIIEVKFGKTSGDLDITIHNTCDPRFQHLDSEYRCAASRRRELCISQMDDALIGEDGKPLASIPGSWTTTLKPNAELPVTLKFYEHGWQYTDFLEAPYKLWEEHSATDTSSRPESVFEDDTEKSFATDDEGNAPFGRIDEVSPQSRKVEVDKGPTQKSPRSGRETPIDGDLKKGCEETPKSKSPCSGKEAPTN